MPDPKRAPLVREAFGRFATGLYTKGEVRAYVNDMGLRTLAGAKVAKLQDGVTDLRKRRSKLYQAHLDGQVPTDVHMELVEANKAELRDAESRLASARMDEICVEEVLDFCERLLTDVPMLWRGCGIDQQQRLQQVLFPEGITYGMKTGYGTTTTCMFFNLLREDLEGKNGLVALTGIEPVSQP